MRNLLQNTFYPKIAAITENALHLPKPR